MSPLDSTGLQWTPVDSSGLQWTPVDCPTMMCIDLAESPYGVQWSPYGIRGGQTRPPLEPLYCCWGDIVTWQPVRAGCDPLRG